MSEAVGVVAPYAMEHFKLRRLEASVFAWNPASMRVLERAGFVLEGTSRASVFKDGELIDEANYALVDLGGG
jgi:RimJ/RimL family protein N-acetyltransferase